MPYPPEYLDKLIWLLEYAAKNPAMSAFAMVSVVIIIKKMLSR